MHKLLTGILAFICLVTFLPISAVNANTSVSITAPSNGQIYTVNDSITVKWTTVSYPADADVDIYLYPLRSATWDSSNPSLYIDDEAWGSNNNPGDITFGADTKNSAGQFTWKVPAYIASQTKNYAINIRIFDYSNDPTTEIETWSSGYFTITGSATKPTLQMMNPSRGPAGTWVELTGSNFFPNNTVTYALPSGTVKTITGVQSSDTETVSFRLPEDLIDGVYQIALTTSNGASNSLPFTVANDAVMPHSVGTNFRGSDGTVYRIVEGNYRAGYTSAGAFLSYKFNGWGNVVSANGADMALPLSSSFISPRNGSLINDTGTVYLITGGLRAGFTSEAVFKGLGYTYANVYPGDTSFMTAMTPINSAAQKHSNGTLINDNGTLYIMKNGYRAGFPTMAVLDSWGYWANEAVPANSYDRQAMISGVIEMRMTNQVGI